MIYKCSIAHVLLLLWLLIQEENGVCKTDKMREDAGQKELSIWWSELCFEIDWASAGCLSLRCWWRLPSDPYDL